MEQCNVNGKSLIQQLVFYQYNNTNRFFCEKSVGLTGGKG